jgi:hypothetical protein
MKWERVRGKKGEMGRIRWGRREGGVRGEEVCSG